MSGLAGLGGIGGVDKLDVSVTLAALRVAVGDDANAGDLAELFELTSEPLLVNVPAEVADEKVASGLTLGALDLALLGGVLGGSLGLALLVLNGRGLLLLIIFAVV